MGTGFEKMQKPRFARPFHWLGGLSLLIGLYKLAKVPLLTWIGVDFLEAQAATGWSLAISGFLFLVVTYLLESSIRLERRRLSNYLEWVCPVFILGGFYQAALSSSPILDWQASGGIWLAIGPFIAAVAMFIALTARSWRPRFMISAMAWVQ